MASAKFNPQALAVVVNATLRGPSGVVREIRVLVDTGASYMMIPWQIANALGYTPEVSKFRVDIVTASGVERVPVIKLDSVTVLKEEARDVEAVVHELPPRGNVDGLLGLSFLRNFKLTLDMRKGFLELIQE